MNVSDSSPLSIWLTRSTFPTFTHNGLNNVIIHKPVTPILLYMGFPHSSVGKESACNAGDPSQVPGSERSAGDGIGYPLQYSILKNSMDCPWNQLSDFHFHFHSIYIYIKKFIILPALNHFAKAAFSSCSISVLIQKKSPVLSQTLFASIFKKV